MTTGPTPHVFLTRFNLPANRVEQSIFSPEWLTARMRLFEAYTVPSVRAQEQEGLSWVIYLDQQGTPDWLRERMTQLQEELPLHPIYLDRALDPETIRAHVLRVSGRTMGPVVTSNLDNDDGLATDFVQRVRRLVPATTPSAIYLTKGLIWHGQRVYLRQDRNNAFVAVVDDIASADYLSCWAGVHDQLESVMPAVREAGNPAWLQVVHGRNVSNRVAGQLVAPGSHGARFPGLIDDLPDVTLPDRVKDLAARPARLARDKVVRPGATLVRTVIGPRRYEDIKMAIQGHR
ncbi:glycosyltransferase [Ornithinimicrobium pratense]|uniref:Rhamnosyl transferase n=1 Tax=Ornithinimicrobium pratense TaxID=2593973 RepID=A0A5J6V9F7_9MICO|nr:glycosyltransferase [Ornithinimicrobium pratense]QFG69773.1 hypothetical protein FY030_14660 [Ornithinimicrobium pratense]